MELGGTGLILRGTYLEYAGHSALGTLRVLANGAEAGRLCAHLSDFARAQRSMPLCQTSPRCNLDPHSPRRAGGTGSMSTRPIRRCVAGVSPAPVQMRQG